jgi:hypothetical protein
VALWFDSSAGPDAAASFDAGLIAALGEYAEFPTPASPPSSAQRWLETSFALRVSGGKTQRRATTHRCLSYALAGVDLASFEAFAVAAERRGERVRRSPKSLVWQAGPQSGELVEEGTRVDVELCTELDAQRGSPELQRAFRTDWRLTPAVELSGQIAAEPVMIVIERAAGVFEAAASFELRTEEQIETTLEWLEGNGFATDALALRWQTRVGTATVEVEASPWDALPVRIDVATRTPI